MAILKPPQWNVQKTIFLAGGISGCEDWQKIAEKELNISGLHLFNPRREGNFTDAMEREQIEWEFHHLKKADAVMFWFAHETLCPITLYELGKISNTEKKLFVGCHPKYRRINDVIIQTGLIRPEVQVVTNLADLFIQIKDWATHKY